MDKTEFYNVIELMKNKNKVIIEIINKLRKVYKKIKNILNLAYCSNRLYI